MPRLGSRVQIPSSAPLVIVLNKEPVGAFFILDWKGGVSSMVQVSVRENDVEKALRSLKKKLQREGVFKEMKERRHYKKPSIKKAEAKDEAIRRVRKLERKRRSSE